MESREANLDSSRCIHCKKCTQNCVFLKKYDLDIGSIKERKELAYHCFLCGKCSQVCPQGIDGRQIILHIRQERVRRNRGHLDEHGYRFLLKEKEKYVFQNYKHVKKGVALFPGCNFPSFYPETTRFLYQKLNEYQQTGLIFDCCGKPVDELGKVAAAQHIVDSINMKLKKAGVVEVIMLCPNCYYFLHPKLSVKVVSIYEKLRELNLGNRIDKSNLHLFIPCPDRRTEVWSKQLEAYLPAAFQTIETAQCCGLGGGAGAKEPKLSRDLRSQIRQHNYGDIYTYCATCSGNMTKSNCGEIHHVLSEILGVKEKADTKKSFINRLKTKYM